MSYKGQIILFMFTIVLVNCNKTEKNFNLVNKNIQLSSKDSSKTRVAVNTDLQKNWDGDYSIKTKAISNNENHHEVYLRYYINIKDNKAILSIGAEFSEDYWCEGEYYLENKDGGMYATGKCDENDINDFTIKQSNNHYYIKSKRFKNTDWQLLKKE